MSTMETNPMISTTVRIWHWMGFIYHKDSRRFITILPSSCVLILQLSYLVFGNGSIADITLNAFFVVIILNSLLRVIYILSRRQKFEQFCERFVVLYNAAMDSGDQGTVDLINLMAYRGILFSRLNVALGALATFLFQAYPRLIGSPKLPYQLYLRGVDFEQSPAYEYGYLCDIFTTLVCVVLYIPFINIIMSFIVFGIALIQDLHAKLKSIAYKNPYKNEGPVGDGETDPQVNNELIELRYKLYIEYHKRIIRYVEELNELVAMINLAEIVLFGIVTSALLFLTVIVKTGRELVLACIYIFMIMYQLFNFYWLSNELIKQSEELAFAVYDSPWYLFSIKNRKSALIMMIRAQRPLNIMIGSVAPVTLQTFQSILNVSYSYFTILRRNYTRGD